MYRRLAILLLLGSLPTAAVAGPPSFPYKGYINADGVYVRSGPGNNYYPTDKLESGAVVEIYRHDPGGWYAIKPPEGSFTWVASRYLQFGKDHLATVNGDRVAARVGSRFSDIRDVIQVPLDRGELVEVLETKTISGDKDSAWCKIAPPSGEFRWVFGKYVDRESPQAGIRKASSEGNPLLPPSSPPQPLHHSADAMPPAPAGPDAAPHHPPHADKEPTAYMPRLARADADSHEPPPMRALSPEEFQTELDRLNLDLSTMLVEEPTVWTCDALAWRAEDLMARAETAIERGRARLLVNRIQQAQEIKSRFDAILTAQADIQRQDHLLADLSRLRSSTAPAEARPAANPKFDGTGRLTRVVPSKLGAPQYALVDDKGKVRCYVTPAPGMNLQYYVGRRVGINGVRGFMPEQKAQHVTAKYVTNLDRRLWGGRSGTLR